MDRRRHCSGWPMILIMLILLPFNTNHALGTAQTHIQIKAAFVFQMSKFIDWPHKAGTSLTFCTVKGEHRDSVFTVLMALKKQGKLNIERHPIALEMRHEDPALLSTYRDCALIYFHPDIEHKIPAAILISLSKTKLVIGNSKPFIAKGGLTAIVTQNAKLKLFINHLSYKQSRVKIKSRLMSLASLYPQ